ncbi:uncharacterized protein N7482_001436 [Penicillium canariense]|uniref:Uncharacterized protein n=1 Tax=Penicillium canariense TaxID=189055 RepID=A0A9W9IFY2_9EURO|nr:uncharacterized protein N7482_001436 [Penicillium canariense]KAJ5175559.1 hypothetical protein N7482_001436 [Penicillium canariense]
MCHLNAPLKAIQIIQTPEQDDIVPLISDLIAMGMTVELQALLPKLKLPSPWGALTKEAAFCGKLEIFQLLWERLKRHNTQRSEQYYVISCACESIRGENIEVLEYLAPKVQIEPRYHLREGVDYMKLGANSESSLVFDIWKKKAGDFESHCLIYESLLGSLTESAKQERFADLLEENVTCGRLSRHQLSLALRRIASTTCAPSIARVLLKNGAVVDYKTKSTKGSELIRTPLLMAAGKNTKAGAELMKVLLLAGADPNASYRPKKDGGPKSVSMEIGAKSISKWLPFSWNELVEWTAAERSNNLQAKGTRPIDS